MMSRAVDSRTVNRLIKAHAKMYIDDADMVLTKSLTHINGADAAYSNTLDGDG